MNILLDLRTWYYHRNASMFIGKVGGTRIFRAMIFSLKFHLGLFFPLFLLGGSLSSERAS
jgi:hypothetical protein